MKVTLWKDRVGPVGDPVEINAGDVKNITPFDLTNDQHKITHGSAITLKDGKRVCVAESPEKLGVKPTAPAAAPATPPAS